jgi:hypothetical protein
MFWSCREAGVFGGAHPGFENWYVKFISHFVRIYEGDAPHFAKDSARWSLDPMNIEAYRANGNKMGVDVLGPTGQGISREAAFRQLPREEARTIDYADYVN